MKRILIIHPDGNVNDNPNLSEFCNILDANGFCVDILSPRKQHIPYQTPAKCKARLHVFSNLNDINLKNFHGFSIVIGIDAGIIPAEGIAKRYGIPFIFLSYEILFDDEIKKRKDKILKKKIKNACKKVSFSIVQDKIRGFFLEKEYGISKDKIYYMPVAGKKVVEYERSDFLHESLNISKDKKILLYTGTISDWSKVHEVCKKAYQLPDDWVFVIHGRYGVQVNNFKYPKVYVSSFQQSDIKDMKKIIQSAECCLALYYPTYSDKTSGKNIENIGFSSGKISMALQHGVPVATNEIGEMSDLIKEYEAGIVINIENDNPFEKLNEILSLKDISSSCHKLFNDYLSIEKSAFIIIDEIGEIIERTNKNNLECPVCGINNSFKKLELHDDRYGFYGVFNLRKCLECGHHFISDMQSIDIGKLYTDFYPRSNIEDEYVEPKFTKKSGFNEWLDGDLRSAFRHVPEHETVLDIGCGDCKSLYYYKDVGCDFFGIEADENVRFLKDVFGERLIIGEYKNNLFERESFNYVTMDQVIEHFENPLTKLCDINRVLKKKGKIIISTPNSSSWGAIVFRKYWINWHAPYHLNVFSKKSIKTALEATGFKVIKIRTITSSEWLRYQWPHMLFFPENGEPSYFWSNTEKKKKIKVKIGRQKLNRYFYNLFNKTLLNHIFTRAFDAFGVGDNLLIIAEKK